MAEHASVHHQHRQLPGPHFHWRQRRFRKEHLPSPAVVLHLLYCNRLRPFAGHGDPGRSCRVPMVCVRTSGFRVRLCFRRLPHHRNRVVRSW